MTLGPTDLASSQFELHGKEGFKGGETHTSQTVNGNQVQGTQEEFISEQDGAQEISQDQSTQVILGISEFAHGGEDDAGQVEHGDKGEQLSVRVEPEAPKDPFAVLHLWFRCRLLRGLCGN